MRVKNTFSVNDTAFWKYLKATTETTHHLKFGVLFLMLSGFLKKKKLEQHTLIQFGEEVSPLACCEHATYFFHWISLCFHTGKDRK